MAKRKPSKQTKKPKGSKEFRPSKIKPNSTSYIDKKGKEKKPSKPKTKAKKALPTPRKRVTSFSTDHKPTALQPFAQGGNVAILVSSKAKAKQILKRYHTKIQFWQVSKVWKVSLRNGRTKSLEGFSPVAIPAKRKIDRHKIDSATRAPFTLNTLQALERLLGDSAQSAANKATGSSGDYEGKAPGNVTGVKLKRGKKIVEDSRFYLILWFTGKQRQSFLKAQKE